MSFRPIIQTIKIFLINNKTTILTASACALTISAMAETVRATSKAKDIIDELEYQKFEAAGAPEEPNIDCRLNKKEIVQNTWKCYIWAFLLMSGAITCCVCSHVSSTKKLSAMTMAYASLLETYNTYQDNVRKHISQKDVRTIEHGVVHDIIQEDNTILTNKGTPPKIVVSNDATVYFRDAYSAKGTGAFKMSMNDARIAVSRLNKYMTECDCATLNDWYDFLGLGHSEIGDTLGWRWMEDGPLYLRIIPDDVDSYSDDAVVCMIGLASDENCSYFLMPKPIY